jgi:acid stress-induced BolA-like protein IbaG/YrbA
MVKNNKLIEHNLKLQNHLKIRGFGKHKNAGVLNSLLKYYAKLKKLILDPIDDLFEIPEF